MDIDKFVKELKKLDEKTKHIQEMEDMNHHYLVCRDNPVYFIENFVKFEHHSKDTPNISLYDFQKKLIKMLKENKFNIAHGCRQVGLTTIPAAYLLHRALFSDNQKIFIISPKIDYSKDILRIIMNMYNHLPCFLKSGITENLKSELRFNNGSIIKIVHTDLNSLRGHTADFIWLNMFAHIPHHKQEEIMLGIILHMYEPTTVFMSDTAAHDPGLFKLIFERAENGTNDYVALKISWKQNPILSNEYKDKIINTLGKRVWELEYECYGMFPEDKVKEDHYGTRKKYKFKDT